MSDNSMIKAPSGGIQEPGQPSFVRLEFALDKVSRQLSVNLLASDEPLHIDLKNLRTYIDSKGYSCADIDDVTLLDVLRKVRKGDLGSVVLGILQPSALVTLEYDETSKELFAELKQSRSAPDITLDVLKDQIRNAGYGVFNIDDGILEDITHKAQHRICGRYLVGRKSEYIKIDYVLDEETDQLFADLSSAVNKMPITSASIQATLTQLNYDNFHFENNILEKLADNADKGKKGRYLVGTRCNADIDIQFDEELMTAYITVSPPEGGRELDKDLLDKALKQAGIYSKCCDIKTLKQVLKNKSADHLEFAKGREPVDGVDVIFEALVQEVEYNKPKESKTGKIDLREVINFTLVEENMELMRRVPPKPSINGRNVKGQVIPAIEAIDTPFNDDLPGTRISDTDPNLLLSSCKGHPVILTDGVRVDNTIMVNNVDMSTGNITYDGSVMIKGEVSPGMKVKVTGDIIVKGVVTKACLQAKNNITIECGIIGSDPSKDGHESPPAIIKAGGSIQAQYINLAEVTSNGDIDVREYISHCTISSNNKVLIGQRGGKGKIFGGSCYGQMGVFANTIGANGGIKTLLSAGTHPNQQKQFEQLVKSHKNRMLQSQQLSKILAKYQKAVQANPKDLENQKKAVAIEKVLSDIKKEIDKMLHTIEQVNRLFDESKNAQVSVRSEMFPNVTININDSEFNIRQESKGGVFVKKGDDIRWLNYSSQKKQ